jgi:hypothetical protein
MPTGPTCRYQPARRAAVIGDTWNRSAARRTGQPSSTTQRASRRRPNSDNGALRSDTKTSSDMGSETARTSLGGLPQVSTPRRT